MNPDERRYLNDDDEWSVADLRELMRCLDEGKTLRVTAEYLCRNERSVVEKARELGRLFLSPRKMRKSRRKRPNKKPELVSVDVIPWTDRGLYGISCTYDDGVVIEEVWGGKGETELAASIRRRNIKRH